jgi:hypothetical protein
MVVVMAIAAASPISATRPISAASDNGASGAGARANARGLEAVRSRAGHCWCAGGSHTATANRHAATSDATAGADRCATATTSEAAAANRCATAAAATSKATATADGCTATAATTGSATAATTPAILRLGSAEACGHRQHKRHRSRSTQNL